MNRLPEESRRDILQKKLSGATNREVATKFDVSVGTVVNILAEAREGSYPEFDSLDHQVDALVDLAKRLEAESLDVSTAHAGLDVLDWLDEMALEPAQVHDFRDRLVDLATSEDELDAYAKASLQLGALEERTDLAAEGRLGDLIERLADKDEAELRRLDAVSSKLATLSEDDLISVNDAISNALAINNLGFSHESATALAREVADLDDGDIETVIMTLRERYEEYDRLEQGVEELQTEKEALDAELDDLREICRDLERNREQLVTSLETLEETLETHEASLASIEETKSQLRREIERRREERQTVEAEYKEAAAELREIQEERDVVHAYRRFLREKQLSETLVSDIATLLDILEGRTTEVFRNAEPLYRENIEKELYQIAQEMFEGEDLIPVSEHERKLKEKGRTEQTLADLETKRDAVLMFLDFLETGRLSEDLLSDLLEYKRGEGFHLETEIDRRTEEVRSFLLEELTELTEGESVIAVSRHHEILDEHRGQTRRELRAAFESVDTLATHVRSLRTRLDDDWTETAAEQVVARLDDIDEPSDPDTLQTALSEALTEELDRRVEAECEQRILKARQQALEEAAEGSIIPGHQE
jgi:hypothetical protein